VIYICVPAHNEERTAGVLLWKIRQVMADFPRDYQILVMDDASTDHTAEVLAPYARVLPLTIARSATRRGYAASVEALLRESVQRSRYPKRDVAVTLQADFTDEPGDIPALVKRLEAGADIVSGRPRINGAAPRPVRWGRRLLGRVLRRVAGVAADPLSGFRAYRLITLKRAFESNGRPLLKLDGWAANAELLRAVAPHARRIDEVDVETRYTRRVRPSRFRLWDTAFQLLRLRRTPVQAPGAVPPLFESAEERALPAGRETAAAQATRRRRRPPRSGARTRSAPTGEAQPPAAGPAGGGQRGGRAAPAGRGRTGGRGATRAAGRERPAGEERHAGRENAGNGQEGPGAEMQSSGIEARRRRPGGTRRGGRRRGPRPGPGSNGQPPGEHGSTPDPDPTTP